VKNGIELHDYIIIQHLQYKLSEFDTENETRFVQNKIHFKSRYMFIICYKINFKEQCPNISDPFQYTHDLCPNTECNIKT